MVVRVSKARNGYTSLGGEPSRITLDVKLPKPHVERTTKHLNGVMLPMMIHVPKSKKVDVRWTSGWHVKKKVSRVL